MPSHLHTHTHTLPHEDCFYWKTICNFVILSYAALTCLWFIFYTFRSPDLNDIFLEQQINLSVFTTFIMGKLFNICFHSNSKLFYSRIFPFDYGSLFSILQCLFPFL